MRRFWAAGLLLLCGAGVAWAQGGQGDYEYKLLATSRTATMEKEMNEAAATGFMFRDVRSGETAFGGDETLVVMERPLKAPASRRYSYKLLATSKTSTMQKELQEASDKGFVYRGTTIFKKFIGKEVVVILERETDAPAQQWDYKLLATNRTGTMQKELSAEAANGYEFVGLAVGETAFGGTEVVTILRRARK
jgi:hypothetical protein